MKRETFFRCVLLLLVVFSCMACGETRLRLTSEGKALYDIVITPEASPAECFAARELADYLEEIGGAEFSVRRQPTDRPAIFVGGDPEADFVDGMPLLNGEQFGIFVRGDDVVLSGGSPRAVCYAVYGFLKELGCRWIAPDFGFYEGRSRYVPTRTDIVYRYGGDAVGEPGLKYRKLYVEEGKSHDTESLKRLIDWMPKLGFNTLVIPIDYQGSGRVRWDNWREELIPELEARGIVIEVGGHGYENFLNAKMEGGRLFRMHPEWFGMDEKGRRTPDKHMVFCSTNPDAVRYLQNNVVAYLKSHPEIEIFDFWPPDMERWCMCPECRKNSPERRHFELVNQMAKVLRKECPGVTLECLAYSRYVTPPEGIRLDPDVLLDFCPVTQNYEKQFYETGVPANESFARDLARWRAEFEGDISIYSYYRKYKWRSLPNVFPHYLQNELKYFRDAGMQGISVYSEPGDWFAYGPNYYVLGHLACRPETDVDSLMHTYTCQLYREEAPLMDSVYAMLEEVVRQGCYFADSSPKSLETYDGYSARVGKVLRQVSEARARCADSVTAGHLGRVELMLEYVRRSILQQRQCVEEGRRGDYRLTDELKRFFREHRGKGVFVI